MPEGAGKEDDGSRCVSNGGLAGSWASITFPFRAKAPHLLRPRSVDLQFRLAYRDVTTNKLTSESIGRKVTIFPSAFAVPTGAMAGAACGYGIKVALQSTATAIVPLNLGTLGGSVLLGLLVALLTSKRADTYKVVTVEDFIGGFIVGALTGMFSEAMIDRLRSLVMSNVK